MPNKIPAKIEDITAGPRIVSMLIPNAESSDSGVSGERADIRKQNSISSLFWWEKIRVPLNDVRFIPANLSMCYFADFLDKLWLPGCNPSGYGWEVLN